MSSLVEALEAALDYEREQLLIARARQHVFGPHGDWNIALRMDESPPTHAVPRRDDYARDVAIRELRVQQLQTQIIRLVAEAGPKKILETTAGGRP